MRFSRRDGLGLEAGPHCAAATGYPPTPLPPPGVGLIFLIPGRMVLIICSNQLKTKDMDRRILKNKELLTDPAVFAVLHQLRCIVMVSGRFAAVALPPSESV
jgi:hypothetical protein